MNDDDIKFIHKLKKDDELVMMMDAPFYPREKENNYMNIMKNFHFGPCGDRAKISHLGIAVKNLNGEWVSFDRENNDIVNVDLISFGDGDYVYMIPAALKDVVVGDAIVHNGHIVFVKQTRSNSLSVIDVTAGEVKKILPTKSIFGFDFVTKVVSLIDFSSMAANEDNPFGNLLPLLMLSNNRHNSNLPLTLMLMGNQQQQDGELFPSSPSSLAMMAMLTDRKDNDSQDFLPLMLLMSSQKK